VAKLLVVKGLENAAYET